MTFEWNDAGGNKIPKTMMFMFSSRKHEDMVPIVLGSTLSRAFSTSPRSIYQGTTLRRDDYLVIWEAET